MTQSLLDAKEKEFRIWPVIEMLLDVTTAEMQGQNSCQQIFRLLVWTEECGWVPVCWGGGGGRVGDGHCQAVDPRTCLSNYISFFEGPRAIRGRFEKS